MAGINRLQQPRSICPGHAGKPHSKQAWRTHFAEADTISNTLIIAGFWLLASAWKVLYDVQRHHKLATTGPYARIRHPQYAGFILIMLGFLFQWPTVITIAMFPVLVFMYVRLARREELEALTEFGDEYSRYMTSTPSFFPQLGATLDPPQH